MRVVLAVLLMLSLALAGCGNKTDSDEDGDGISDKEERRGWLVRVDYLRERVEYVAKSDAHNSDSDNDGLPDNEEFLLGLDPSVADTDKDGLTDCQEERHTNATECENPPAGLDADGGYHTDPLKADSDTGSGRFVRREGWFTDSTGTLPDGPIAGDGVSDGDEVLGYAVTVAGGATRTVKTDPRDADHDNDGLGDGEEREYRGDPTVPDTDGDGCDDGGDPFPDREELLNLGLLDFTLAPGRADTDFSVHIGVASTGKTIPASGTLHATASQPVDLRGHTVEMRPGSCTFPAFEPDVIVTVTVFPKQGTLDATSRTGPLHWNLRTAQLSWEDGTLVEAPVSMSGLDGVIRLAPTA